MAELHIISSSLNALNNSSSSNYSIDIGLILGISIPLGIIGNLLFYFSFYFFVFDYL